MSDPNVNVTESTARDDLELIAEYLDQAGMREGDHEGAFPLPMRVKTFIEEAKQAWELVAHRMDQRDLAEEEAKEYRTVLEKLVARIRSLDSSTSVIVIDAQVLEAEALLKKRCNIPGES